MSDELHGQEHEEPTPQAAPPAFDALDGAMGGDARERLKSFDLPAVGQIPEPLKQQVRDAARQQLRDHRTPQSALAVACGVASERLGQVLRGKATSDDSAIIRKINAWLDDDERRRRRSAPIGFFETGVFISMRDAAAYAKQHARTAVERGVNVDSARIVLVHGPSGCGKSVGVRALAAWDPNAIAIRIAERCGSAAGVARAIVAAESWRGVANRRVGVLVEEVLARLHHSGRLLVVDEAHRLTGSGYEFLRDLADMAGIPILLVATPRIQRRIDEPRMGLGSTVMDDQFARRVALVVDLVRGTDGKGGSKRPIFSEQEIVAIFNQDRVRLRLTDDAVEFLQALACMIGGGMLGQAANIFDKARLIAQRGDGVIDGRLLRLAAERVLQPAGVSNGAILRGIESQLAVNRQIGRPVGGVRAASA